MAEFATDTANALVARLRIVAPGVAPKVDSLRLRQALGKSSVVAVPGPGWALEETCLFSGLDAASIPHLERLRDNRVRLRKGEVLFHAGHKFTALHALRTGSCKIIQLARNGQEQVTAHHMAGDVIGTDGIGTGFHECQATALEDSEVCPLPFNQLENLGQHSERFRHNLQQLLLDESARTRAQLVSLGTLRAHPRLAMFLLDLSHRYRARGYSSLAFVLRMTRREIGSYLNLKLETVSRILSRFQQDGLIRIEGRKVELLDAAAMARLVDSGA